MQNEAISLAAGSCRGVSFPLSSTKHLSMCQTG
uniref:Uncharacterized protein n=1 Tax=Anguilla anguilla TaxID=7936 RepID=A0A0E9TCE9_ANGAN